MTKIRVLVVEDSPTVRHRLREVLASDAELDVSGEATDGAQAIELCRRHRPDVITMDMMLPVMDGVVATEHIMARWPTPILVVSSSTNRAELLNTCDALAAGAVDVLEKPRGDEADGAWERRLLYTVKLVSRIRVITHPRARWSTTPVHRRPGEAVAQTAPSPAVAAPPVGDRPGRTCAVIAIGASTGGPAAVVEALRPLTRDFTIPILLVQHIGAPFAATYTEWLSTQIHRPVAYPSHGDPVAAAAGRVVVAPPDCHLTVRDNRLWLTAEPERHSCRPSADTLFESVAEDYADTATGCLLSGMGRDGAAGLLAMRRAGAFTVAQEESTCVVYGMPREAIRLGAASQILSPDGISRLLARLVAAPQLPQPRPR